MTIFLLFLVEQNLRRNGLLGDAGAFVRNIQSCAAALLEEMHGNRVLAGLQLDLAFYFHGSMQTVVVDYFVRPDVQAAAVVGGGEERVAAFLLDFDEAAELEAVILLALLFREIEFFDLSRFF